MFENIGGKIKCLAKVMFSIEVISSIFGAIACWTKEYGNLIGIGFLVIIVGPLFAWISNFFVFGFGDLIEKVTQIEASAKCTVFPKPTTDKRKETIENLYSNSLISKEEYETLLNTKEGE